MIRPGARNQPGRGGFLCGWDPGQVPGQITVSAGEKCELGIVSRLRPGMAAGRGGDRESPPQGDLLTLPCSSGPRGTGVFPQYWLREGHPPGPRSPGRPGMPGRGDVCCEQRTWRRGRRTRSTPEPRPTAEDVPLGSAVGKARRAGRDRSLSLSTPSGGEAPGPGRDKHRCGWSSLRVAVATADIKPGDSCGAGLSPMVKAGRGWGLLGAERGPPNPCIKALTARTPEGDCIWRQLLKR